MATLLRNLVSLRRGLFQFSKPYIPNWTKGRPSTGSPPISHEGEREFTFSDGTTARNYPDALPANNSEFCEQTAQDAEKFFSEVRAALVADYDGHDSFKRYGVWSFEMSNASKARNRRARRQQIESGDLQLEQVEATIKNHYISELLKQRFAGATSEDEHFLGSHILKEMEAGEDYSDGDNSLQVFLALGLDGIRKKRRWDKIKRRLKTALRLLWPVLRSLIAITCVLSIYNALSGKFETVVISILLMIYTSISLNLQGSSFFFEASSRQGEAQFIDLRRSFGKPIKASEQETVNSNIQKTQKRLAPMMIHSSAMGLIDLIAIWNLLKAVQWF
jgi:hypothetical protein